MILKGDCIEVMKAIKPNSVDAVVCDPPYGLEFMGKEWDKLANDWNKGDPAKGYDGNGGLIRWTKPGPRFHAGYSMQLWHTQWLTEAYRVLKPGGSMLVMGGTRTSHRLACAIEDSGFIIKDTIMFLYGSGFPKAQDLGKMIDKRNGVNIERAKELAIYVGKECEKKFSNEQLAKILGRKEKSSFIHHWTNGTYIPRIEELKKLGDLIEIPEKLKRTWQLLEEEAKREKTGIYIAPDGKDRGKYKGQYRHNWTGSIDPNVTAPATDLAKHWDGFKVGGIKPAYEPIIWAVKPPEGSYIDNVLKWGVGAVNVDECRVGLDGMEIHKTPAKSGLGKKGIYGKSTIEELTGKDLVRYTSKGRFPANVILSHHPECVQVGMKRVKGTAPIGKPSIGKPAKLNRVGSSMNVHPNPTYYNDPDGHETVESWDCHPDCAMRLLDEQSGNGANSFRKNPANRTTAFFGNAQYKDYDSPGHNDSGGASRFFYCAKASRAERNAGLEGMEKKEGQKYRSIRANRGKGYPESTLIKNNHPTVKPIKLFEYLIKLVTRQGQIILDPFIGSGTTAIAAHNTGRKCVGIEKEDEYLTIAKRRINYWKNQPKQMEIRA